MSQPIQVVRVGAASTFTPVHVGQAPPSPADVVVGVNRPTVLEELGDVEGASAAAEGAVLTKVSGTWRGLPPEVQDWWTGDGPPPPVITGASPGDFYFDRIGKGLYRLV